MVSSEGPVDRAKLAELLETLEVASLCAPRQRRTGAHPQPDRPLPRRAGGRLMEVFVDGVRVEVEPGTTALEAARLAGTWIPTLCFDDRMAPFGACRVCLVGIEDSAPSPRARPPSARACASSRPTTGCSGSSRTSSSSCSRSSRAARPHRAGSRGASPGRDEPAGRARSTSPKHDARHPYLVFQHELCISCGRCVRACDEVQGAFALTATGRGFHFEHHRRLGLRVSGVVLRVLWRMRTRVRRTPSPSVSSLIWPSKGSDER